MAGAGLPVSPGRPERRESSSASPAASACPGPAGHAPSGGLSRFFRRLRLPTMRRAGGGPASTATPGTAGALARSGRCVAAGLLLAFVAHLALLPEAQAQTTIKMVGNGASSTSHSYLGTNSSASYRELAQQFTTGSNSDGYTLSTASIWFSSLPASADVTNFVAAIYTNSSNRPGTLKYTLTNPSSNFATNGKKDFSAPSNSTLDPSTKYWLVLMNDNATDGQNVNVASTDVGKDSDSLAGWSIENQRYQRSSMSGSWTSWTTELQIRISGYANAAPCDALLCATMTVGISSAFGLSGYSIDNPAIGTLTPSREFTYDGATVRVDRIYFVEDDDELVVDFAGSLAGSDYTLVLGDLSFSLSDPGTGSSWTVTTSDIDWTDGETVTVKLFEGSGGVTLSDDATLTSLVLYAINLELDEEIVTLTPAFASSTTEYTAVVGYRFADASIRNIVRGDSGASVVVTDGFGSHNLGSTEDSVEDLGLAIGENTITMTVTAADGTTETYTLVVTRTAPPPPPAHCEAGDLLCATLTVAALSNNGYGYSGALGALSHIDFEHDGTQYTAKTLFITTATGVGTPLSISFRPSGETVFNTDDFFLYVDGTAFAFSDATFTSGDFEWDNSGLNWSPTDTVEVRLVERSGTAATGEPTISGTARVGQTLTADTSGIADADGITSVSYSYQWIRVLDTVETEISGAESSTYTLVADDVGKTIRVKVTFTDDADNPETAISDAFPSSGTVEADTTPPTLSSAEVRATGSAILLTFSEGLDIATEFLPAAVVAAFSVTADSLDVEIVGVAVPSTGNELSITLQSPAKIAQGQTVTISYDKSAAGSDALEDHAENEVASFTDFAVTNNSTVDTTPPTLSSAEVRATGSAILLTFSEGLDIATEFLPAAVVAAFSVTADSLDVEIVGVAVPSTGNELSITLQSPAKIAQGQTVTISYDKSAAGSDALEDHAENEVASFTDFAVTNNSTVILSTDATLSGLALKNAADDSAIDLNETFATGTKSYTADVLNAVDEITVEPASDHNATFAYLNASDTVLTDADSLKTGFQAALAAGANTIKVKVTAEAGDPHTDTYTVVVTRRAMTTTPPAPAEIAVPNDWSLIPTGLGAGDKFRLLFLSSTKTDGESYDIADYNTFIQGRAAAGHTDIRTYSPGFRAVGCTADSDATANTGTTGTGVVIHWLNGNKVADDYADFYDGNWDEESNSQDKNELGTNGPNTSQSVNYPLTGCDDDGTEDVDGGTSYALGESEVRVARLGSSAGNAGPLTSNSDTAKANSRPMYGLSQVFEVAAAGNTPASGAPAITGAAQVGKVLEAEIGTIADAEGLPGTFPDDYTFQWVQVDADGVSNEAIIDGETSSTYTVVAADVGKKIKVEVSFTDDGGTLEEPDPSAAYPSNAPVAAAAGACPADNDWCTTLTVGFRQVASTTQYGFSSNISDGALVDTTIDDGDGTTWTVSKMIILVQPGTADQMEINLDAFLPRGSVFDLGGTTFTAEAGSEKPTTGRYAWLLPAGFVWVHGQDVTVSVKLPESSPATGAPEISGTPPQVGETLTAGIGDIADLDGLPTTFPDDYTLQWIRVDANGTSNPVDVGTDEDYTLVAADEGKRIKVKVTFTDDAGNAEELTSDAYPTSSLHSYPDFGIPPARTACPTGNDWCATMTVGYASVSGIGVHYGFSASPSHGALDDTSFDHDGSTFTVEAVGIRKPQDSLDYHVRLDLDAFVPRGSVFELNGFEFTADAAAEQSTTGHYQWNIPSGFRIAEGVEFRVSLKLGGTVTPPCDGVWCATLTVKALDGGNHFGCANAQAGKACSNSSTLTDDEFTHASTGYDITSVQVRSNGQLRLWVNPDLVTDSESLELHVGSQTFAFEAANTKGSNYRYWNNSGLSWSAGDAVALKLTEAVAAVTILPAPRLPSVDDPNAIWMATLTVANLGSNKYGYKGSQGGLTDTAFTYLGDDTPLSGGLTYRKVGTLYTIDELSYHTGTGQLLFSLDGEFVGGSAANIFVDVGGTRRSFSQGTYSSGPHTYTFGIPNPSWSAGDEVTVKIVVLEEANGPENLAATSAASGDGFDVTLTWAAPTSGGAVTGYRVEHQPDPALQWRTLAASQSGTTYADSGLGRGTVRYYRVAALRSGEASYSEIVRVQAPSETQEVPEKVNFVDVKPAEGSDTALEVAWNRPRTPLSRAPATGYHVQYARHDGAAPAVRDGEDWATVTFPRWMERLPWRTWSGAVEEIEFEESTERSAHLKTVVTGLAPGMNYRVRVRGCTEEGCGEWSYPRRWTTSGATLNATEAEPLTATLEDFPANHDGSGAFTFRIAFSADVEITPEAMRDHALTVAGGTVTNATQVDDRKDLWELTVEPAGTGAVSILVPQDRACTETGALCTADGQALSTGLGHSVPGPVPSPQGQQALAPLAAGFVSVPPEHDGETEFWLELSFDAAVEQGSKQRIRALLGVTGGSVTRMRRKDGRLDHWRIRIQPSSHGAVTVTLSPSPACGATGAVCTEDGRTFTTALATQIQARRAWRSRMRRCRKRRTRRSPSR